MAERGALTAGQHGGHPPALVAQPVMAHRIDPAEETVQASGRRSPADRVPVEPRRMELRDGHHSVLAGRNAGDNPVRLDAFLSHTETKASRRDRAPYRPAP
jgi:hypothetical protein